METRKIVGCREQAKDDRNNQEPGEQPPVFPKQSCKIAQAVKRRTNNFPRLCCGRRIGRELFFILLNGPITIGNSAPQQIKIDWKGQNHFGSVPKSEREKRSCHKRRTLDQNEVECSHLAEQRETESELP